MPFTGETYNFNGPWKATPGVYGIMNSDRQMIYIGETNDFQRRMAEHHADTEHCMHQYGPALVRAEVIEGGEPARKLRESTLIAEYGPVCNQTR